MRTRKSPGHFRALRRHTSNRSPPPALRRTAVSPQVWSAVLFTLTVLIMMFGTLRQAQAGKLPKIAAGGAHTCALTANGRVQCWGDNGYGELGDGTGKSTGLPPHCALRANGEVQCWGWNQFGQLGDGTNTFAQHSPVRCRDCPAPRRLFLNPLIELV